MDVMKKGKDLKFFLMFNLVTLFGFLLGLAMYKIFKQSKRSKDLSFSKVVRKEEDMEISSSEFLGLTDRQQKIMVEIIKKETLLPSEIYALLPNVTTRTIRRDMDALVLKGLVLQEGSTKSTKYLYKKM